MLLLTEPQVDRLVMHRRLLLLSGIACMVTALALPRGWGIGFFTGFMLASLGIYCFAYRAWRTEPGLWMLACLLTIMLTPCWAYFEYRQLLNLMAARAANNQNAWLNWNAFRLSVDGLLALLVFGKTIRLSLTVAIRNYRLTRTPARPGMGVNNGK